MKKIMIIADSAFMPRIGYPYETTWIYLIKKKYPRIDFIDKSARGSTSSRLASEGGGGYDLLETYNPQAAIVQLGMVDCAPRLFDKNSFEYRLAREYLPARLGKKYADYVKSKRGRRPEYTEVTPEDFRKNLSGYVSRASDSGCRIIFIKIMPANSLLKIKSPNASGNIVIYNKIIDAVCSEYKNAVSIDPLGDMKILDSIALDETHVNGIGQTLTFKMIQKTLVKMKLV